MFAFGGRCGLCRHAITLAAKKHWAGLRVVDVQRASALDLALADDVFGYGADAVALALTECVGQRQGELTEDRILHTPRLRERGAVFIMPLKTDTLT